MRYYPDFFPLQGDRHAAPQPARPAEPREVMGGARPGQRGPGPGDGGLPPGDPARAPPPPGGRHDHHRPRRPRLHPRTAPRASTTSPAGRETRRSRSPRRPSSGSTPRSGSSPPSASRGSTSVPTSGRPPAAISFSPFPTAASTPRRDGEGRARAPVPRRGDHHARLVRVLGTKPQQEKALATLNELAASKDARVAALATWSRDNRPSKESIDQALAPIPK